MPAISYMDFGGGLDRRLPINVQEASRLWVLRNAYVTQGKRIRKRPCLSKRPGTFIGTISDPLGLSSINGQLTVFVRAGGYSGLPTEVVVSPIPDPPGHPYGVTLLDVPYAVVFQGFPYVIAKWRDNGDGSVFYRHSYNGTDVSDVNCPHSASATVAASRIFAIDGDVVRYCKAGDATNWTAASDAGFLPVGLQQNTISDTTAVGTFEDALVVLFEESAQVWDVAVDPSANKIRKRLYSIGTKFPYSLANFANDLAFLSPFGFRSMYVTSQTDRIDDNDLGSPIDSLVEPEVRSIGASDDTSKVKSFWIPQLGQYWSVFDMGTYSKAWVYTYSRSSKIAAWSEYVFPIRILGLATSAGKVYVRDTSFLYEFSDDEYTDDGTAPAVEVQMAFQDAKSPGVLKQFHSADFVFAGSWDVSYKYDPRDQGKETIAQTITGDTRPGDLVPVEVCAPAIAPVFRHEADEAAEVDAVTMFFDTLGLMG